jgi:Arc/MetJ-type ribon-helix-helix transcriptional regulator
LTVRLPPGTERALNALARRRRQTRSDVVREAIVHYTAAGTHESDRPLDAWADVIGIVDLGHRSNDDRTTGERFTDIVRRKARARRSR